MDTSSNNPNASHSSTSGCPAHAVPSREERFKVGFGDVDETARAQSIASPDSSGGDTAILLVSHGSHSPSWRHMLLDVHRDVGDQLLELPGVTQVRSAFMEYTEPSIATQLRELDAAGVQEVLVIPLLLTISDHSFDDIPVVCGQREDPEKVAELAAEHIEVYAPDAHLTFAPLLDFTDLVERNLARRLGKLVGTPQELEGLDKSLGLVLVGYGSADFDDEWHAFFDKIDRYAEAELGVAGSTHAWCGHLVEYSRQPTIDAIEAQLEKYDRVALIPIFVAYDEMFHQKIMGRAAERCSAPERVFYSNDSILPEPAVAEWIVEISGDLLKATATT
jgi:sirohydrochlorin ferrochelatase